MSPLRVEVYRPDVRQWTQAGEVKPGDPSGSMSDNKPDGTRDLYIFECSPDDSKSTIYKSELGVDVSQGNLRAVISDRTKWNIIKELRKNASFEMNVRTDISSHPRQIRFTHR